MRTVLVTAFEPFGGERDNASELAVRPLEGRVIADHRLVVEILPCVFGVAAEALRAAIARAQPSLVIACGEASERQAISLERIAINLDDARIADNRGAKPVDRAIADGGVIAYWSTLPIKAMGRAIFEQKIPVELSQSAGTFVCNHVFYELMRALEGQTAVRGGFVHVPRPHALPTETVTRALEIAIEAAIEAAVSATVPPR
jgi:pyroglutamyl-peptidase